MASYLSSMAHTRNRSPLAFIAVSWSLVATPDVNLSSQSFNVTLPDLPWPLMASCSSSKTLSQYKVCSLNWRHLFETLYVNVTLTGFLWPLQASPGLPRPPLGLPWPPIANPDLPLPPPDSPSLPLPSLVSPGFLWPLLASPGLPWPVLVFPGIPLFPNISRLRYGVQDCIGII